MTATAAAQPQRTASTLEARRVAMAALLALPAALTIYLAFNSGGFYPGPTAYAAILVCVVLALRVTLADNPLAGVSWPMAIATAAIGLYALETLLSEHWSHAPGRALVEFDLPLLYALAMAVFGSVARSSLRLDWALRGLAMAIAAICLCGLLTRLLPHLWPTSPSIANNRLSFPVTYWNALGIMTAFGIVLCLHFTSDTAQPPAGRIAAAGAIPLLAVTMFFTFSRGAILCAAIGIVVYSLLGRPRGLLSAAVSLVPPTAAALAVAYRADLLASPDPSTPAAAVQGRGVAIAVLACIAGAAVLRALAVMLDRRLTLRLPRVLPRRRGARLALISGGAAAVMIALALSGALAHEYNRFARSSEPGSSTDLRSRLTDPGNNGRLDLWRVGVRGFASAPLTGHGAGTFETTWAQHRPTGDIAKDAHSLYVEALDELGVVGLALLLTAMITVLATAATRIRGHARPLHAAVFAVLLISALHAGIDWDWEMPVVMLIFFALGGFVLAGPARAGRSPLSLGSRGRLIVGLVCAGLATAPAYVWLSQRKLDAASTAFAAGDCATATSSALAAISTFGDRPEAYEIVSYCDLRRDMPNLAVAAMTRATQLDPSNWKYHYGLALMRAAAGLDPRRAASRALALDPRDPITRTAWQLFRTGGPERWEGEAKTIAGEFTSL